MPRPSPRFSTEGGLEIEKTDSTTVKPIAEPYFLASVNFYRTAIIFFFIYLLRLLVSTGMNKQFINYKNIKRIKIVIT